MSFNVVGDFIAAIQARSKPGRTYSVAPSTSIPGTTDIMLNGVRIYSYLWFATGTVGPGDPGNVTGAGTDANASARLVQLWDATGTVPTKADAAQFILSLN